MSLKLVAMYVFFEMDIFSEQVPDCPACPVWRRATPEG